MECGIEKCAMLTMESEKRENGKNRNTKSRKKQNVSKKKNYKCLGILKGDTIKQAGRKEKIKRRRKLESKLGIRYLFKGINIWAVSLLGYSRPFFK